MGLRHLVGNRRLSDCVFIGAGKREREIEMTFAHGRQPRESYKALCLKIDPTLVCRQKYASAGLHGYVIYRGEQALTSARSAEEAWSRAYGKLR